MMKYNKIKIYSNSLSFFVILVVVFSFAINIVSAVGGVKGDACSPSQPNSCITGLDCINDKCDFPGSGSGGGSNCANSNLSGTACCSAFPSDPLCDNPNTNPGGSGTVSCPEGLESVNGLCLPKNSNFPRTGIAGSSSLVELLTKVIQLLLTFAGIIAVVFLVLGGYWYMASGGNEELAEKGKKTIVNFVLGLVVIIMAYAIVTILYNTLSATKYVP